MCKGIITVTLGVVNGVSVVSSSTAAIELSGNIVTVMFTLSLASFTLVYIL